MNFKIESMEIRTVFTRVVNLILQVHKLSNAPFVAMRNKVNMIDEDHAEWHALFTELWWDETFGKSLGG